MQAQPIQFPTIATCQLLQDLGLKPPTSDILQAPNICHAWVKDIAFDSYCPAHYCLISGVFNDEYEFSTIKGRFYEDAVFAPTADQLLPLIQDVYQDYLGIDINIGGVLYDKGTYKITNREIHQQIAPNTNLAQYLAEVLIYLLEKQSANE